MENTVDVYGAVYELRMHRSLMVQTEVWAGCYSKHINQWPTHGIASNIVTSIQHCSSWFNISFDNLEMQLQTPDLNFWTINSAPLFQFLFLLLTLRATVVDFFWMLKKKKSLSCSHFLYGQEEADVLKLQDFPPFLSYNEMAVEKPKMYGCIAVVNCSNGHNLS